MLTGEKVVREVSRPLMQAAALAADVRRDSQAQVYHQVGRQARQGPVTVRAWVERVRH